MRIPTNPAEAVHQRDAYDRASEPLSELRSSRGLGAAPVTLRSTRRIADFRNPGGTRLAEFCFPRLLAMPRRPFTHPLAGG